MSKETNGCYEEPIIDMASDLKPKVKVNVTCPHCDAGNVRETCNYHEVLHGDYFKEDEVQDFYEIIEKIDAGEYPYSILADIYYWLPHFYCNECGKGIRVHQRPWVQGMESHSTKNFSIEKAGTVMLRENVQRFWDYLGTKERGMAKGSVGIKCEKERFVERVWKNIKHNIVQKPIMIKDKNGHRDIVYIYNMTYVLGWGEEISLHVVTPLAKMYVIKLDHQGMNEFEWVEVPKNIADGIWEMVNEF